MIEYPRLAFVASPDPSASIRLDLNTFGEVAEGDMWPGHDGFSLGAPSFEGGPGSVSAEYGYRRVAIPLVLTGAKYATSSLLSALGRELIREGGNWLFFQMSEESPPLWLRTWQTTPPPLSFEHLRNGPGEVARWGLEIPLDCDAWLYGERVILDSVTVANDPAAATNPVRCELPAVVGDAPAPATITAEFSADQHGRKHRWAITPYQQGAAPSGPIVWQIGGSDGWTAGTDTGASASSATHSGGSYRPVSFATTASMAVRLSGDAPTPVTPGRYQVFLRVSRSDTSSTFAFFLSQLLRVTYGGHGPRVQMARPASSAAGHKTWVDLGTHTFPFGAPDEVDETTAVTPNIQLQAERTSGTGAAHLDAFLLIPVDTATSGHSDALDADFYGSGPTTDSVAIWDGDSETFRSVDGSGRLKALIPPAGGGGFPRVYPGAANVLHLLLQTSLREGFYGDNSDDITETTTATISYHPRWLWLAAI